LEFFVFVAIGVRRFLKLDANCEFPQLAFSGSDGGRFEHLRRGPSRELGRFA
jgi:hypothetical protein